MLFDNIGKTDEKGHLNVSDETRRVVYVNGVDHHRYVERDGGVWMHHAYDLSARVWEFVDYMTDWEVKRDTIVYSDAGFRISQFNFGTNESFSQWLGI